MLTAHRPAAHWRRLGCALLLTVLATASRAQPSIEISVLDNAALGPVALAVLQRAYDKLGVQLLTRPSCRCAAACSWPMPASSTAT